VRKCFCVTEVAKDTQEERKSRTTGRGAGRQVTVFRRRTSIARGRSEASYGKAKEYAQISSKGPDAKRIRGGLVTKKALGGHVRSVTDIGGEGSTSTSLKGVVPLDLKRRGRGEWDKAEWISVFRD